MPSDFTKITSMTMPLLTELSISNYLSSVAEKQPVPGGGAVAAIVGAEACALQTKVAVFSSNSEIAPIVESSKKTQRKLLELAEKDSKAFLALMKAGKKSENYEELLIEAARVPVEVLRMSVLQVSSLKVLLKLGNLNLVSDIGISALLLISSIKSSLLNIKINTNSIESVPEDILLAEFSAEEALKELESLCLEVENAMS